MSEEIVEIEYPEPNYTLFDTSLDELPAVLVVNAALQGFPHPEVFAWHLSVIIDAKELAERGMPTPEESKVLDAIGDEIEAAVLADSNALFLARQTWNGTRQLVYRVYDPDKVNSVLQVLLAQPSPRRQWDFRMEHDPSWSFAESYLGLFQSAKRPSLLNRLRTSVFSKGSSSKN